MSSLLVIDASKIGTRKGGVITIQNVFRKAALSSKKSTLVREMWPVPPVVLDPSPRPPWSLLRTPVPGLPGLCVSRLWLTRSCRTVNSSPGADGKWKRNFCWLPASQQAERSSETFSLLGATANRPIGYPKRERERQRERGDRRVERGER